MAGRIPLPILANLPFPIAGIDQQQGFGVQRPGTTRDALNVMGFEPVTDRDRGGTRPGLVRYIPDRIPAGPHLIQDLNTVVNGSIGAVNFPNGPAPGWEDDPSSPGPPESWGGGIIVPGWDGVPVTGATLETRNPGPRKRKKRGSGRPPNKNLGPLPKFGTLRLIQAKASVLVTAHSSPIDYFGTNPLFSACMCCEQIYLALAGFPTTARQFNGWWAQKWAWFDDKNIPQNGCTFNPGSDLVTTGIITMPYGIRACENPVDYPGDATHNIFDSVIPTYTFPAIACTRLSLTPSESGGMTTSQTASEYPALGAFP